MRQSLGSWWLFEGATTIIRWIRFQTEAGVQRRGGTSHLASRASAPSPGIRLETNVCNEVGGGTTDAIHWLCAWEVHYLGDPQATRASDTLSELPR